jgi:isoleucyl-tRNA synthetase
MNGKNVRRQAGWDCHGLPIEVMVEQRLGIKNKKEIEDFGIENFIEECKKWAHEHIKLMTSQFEREGVWLDWENPYMTLKDDYIEAAWWTIKKANEKDLLARYLRVATWCPRCETALAEAEIEYADRSDPSIYVKFPLVDRENEYILIWTTTPWTLISNLAVMVHPDFEYVRVKTDDGIFILAKDLVPILKEKFGLDYEILQTLSGADLEGTRYRNPLSEIINVQPESPNAYSVILADFVSLEDGTGCVHSAPGHGPEDFEACEPYGIDIVSPVDERGAFTEEAGKYVGMVTKKDDHVIIGDLEEGGALLLADTVSHRYGHCWRCKTPIIYRATKQWFIKISALKEQMLKEIEKAEWIPEWAGSARFKDWVENARDWAISRQRYWGIPLPIWRCTSCDEIEVIGSKEELESKGPPVKELHKPYVDDVKLKCKCGSEMHRVPDVLDVWFDSGVASWASLGDPSRSDEFDWYPVDFITEGHDQTRGWFYSMLGCGILAFGEIPYRAVLMHGFTLDEKGEKMSKSLGNVVTPEEIIEKYGAEVLRFYVLWVNKPWDDLRFNWEEVKVISKLFNILWNVYVFATTYMSIDSFDPKEHKKPEYKIEDRWILSRLNSTLKEVTEGFETFNMHTATRPLRDFIVEDLSRWYIPLIRQRTWIEKDDPAKISAYATLYEVLSKLTMAMAPISPHITEEMYKNLSGEKESVHFENWVTHDENAIDIQLEKDMNVVRKYVEAEAAAREKSGIKRRWPVLGSYAVPKDEESGKSLRNLTDIITTATSTLSFEVTEPEWEISKEHSTADFEFGTVTLDIEQNDEIRSKGYAREVVRRIQQMRKGEDLDIEAFIEANVETTDEIAGLLERERDYISTETRAKTLNIGSSLEHKGTQKEWNINENTFKISLLKL